MGTDGAEWGTAQRGNNNASARARTAPRWVSRLVPASGTFLHLIDLIRDQAVGLAVDLVGGLGIRCLD